jgi:hypothetical protein
MYLVRPGIYIYPHLYVAVNSRMVMHLGPKPLMLSSRAMDSSFTS